MGFRSIATAPASAMATIVNMPACMPPVRVLTTPMMIGLAKPPSAPQMLMKAIPPAAAAVPRYPAGSAHRTV